MDLEDAYVALVEVLEERGPLAEDELEKVLADEGVEPELIDEVLGYPPEVVEVLSDGRYASLPSLLAPRVLTHRVSAEEAACEVLRLTVDLAPVVPLLDAIPELAEGTAALVIDGREDAEVLEDRDPSAAGALCQDELLLLRTGYFADHGIGAGDVVAVTFTPDGPEVRRLDDAALGAGEPVAALLAAHLGDTPTDIDALVWDLCAADPSFLTAPVPPFSEILESAGFSHHGSQLAVAGVDIEAWHQDQRVAAIAGRHRLPRRDAEAVAVLVEHHELLAELLARSADLSDEELEGEPDGTKPDGPEPGELDLAPYRAAIVDAAAILSSADAAAALLGECAGIGREGAAPLGMLAETLEARVPRSARASLRWLRAKALERLGDALRAEDELRAALAMESDHPLVLEDLGRFASDRGDADQALRYLQRAGVGSDDHLVRILEAHRPRAPKAGGRNDPCWCGSGRKRKQCHRDAGEPLALEDRTAWLVTKTAAWLQEGPHRMQVLALALARSEHQPEGAVLGALGDPLVHDCALVEGGLYDDFLAERGPLLPDDERSLVEQWALVERSVFDVEQARPGQGLVLRDVRTGDRHDVVERAASGSLRPGDLICTRVVPAGSQHQLVGGVEPVSLGQRDALVALLDDDPAPAEVVTFLSARFGPPRLSNTEGEDLVDCTLTIRVPDPAALGVALDARYDRHDEDGRPVWTETVVTMGVDRIRATFELASDTMTVHANSDARADRALAVVLDLAPGAEVLDDRRTPFDELIAEGPSTAAPPSSIDLSEDPELQAALRDHIRAMEDAWVDESIPALGGITPREAAADPTRRDDLLRLLASFEVVEPHPQGLGGMEVARLRALLDL